MRDVLNVCFIDETMMKSMIDVDVNPSNSVYFDLSDRQLKAFAVRYPDGPSQRASTIISYVRQLLEVYEETGKKEALYLTPRDCKFLFQGDDRPVDRPSVSWQRKSDYEKVTIVPDLYYTQNRGYINFFPTSVPDWDRRSPKVFWRGSTTGGWSNTLQSICSLRRYKLCMAGIDLGSKADFAFYDVVQTQSTTEKEKIEQHLKSIDLLHSWVDPSYYANYKFIVQIDGNANSWGIIGKLRLGCCVLLVDSSWTLWHNQYLERWKHFVPVKEDLSDLLDMIEWCLANDNLVKKIGVNGRQFALSLDYKTEISRAAEMVFGSFSKFV